MFQDIIDRLKETERELDDLRVDKAQAEYFLAFIMSHVKELEVDMTDFFKAKADYKKVKLLPNEENSSKVKVFYDEENTAGRYKEGVKAMSKVYLVSFEDDDPILVTVEEDVNRPNNPDCETVLSEFIEDNHGYREYDYIEIDACEKFNI